MGLERKKAKESEKKSSRIRRLVQIAAMAGMVGSAPHVAKAEAAGQSAGASQTKNENQASTVHQRETSENKKNSWQTRVESYEPPRDLLSPMEVIIWRNDTPLIRQLELLQSGWRDGGRYITEIENGMSKKRYFALLRMVEMVSERLTRKLATSPNDPDFTELAAMKDVASSGRTFSYLSTEKGENGQELYLFCNGSMVLVEGDVYFVTAKHCVEKAKRASEYVISNTDDVAVRYIDPREYNDNEWHVGDYTQLPVLDKQVQTRDLYGRIVVSHSWSTDVDSGPFVEKTFASIILPINLDIEQKYIPFNQHTIGRLAMMVGPRIQAEEKSRSATHTFPQLSGSSGSMMHAFVSGPEQAAFVPAGPLSSVFPFRKGVKAREDGFDYALIYFGSTDGVFKLIAQDQQKRRKDLLGPDVALAK